MLGWHEVKRRDDYPAIFVSDGTVTLTLWATKEAPVAPFDKNRNVGLHHVAFTVPDEATLNSVYERLQQAGVPIEFAPEPLGGGPAALDLLRPERYPVEILAGSVEKAASISTPVLSPSRRGSRIDCDRIPRRRSGS